MISLQLFRDDPEGVKAAVARKGQPTEPVDRVRAADERRRELEATANDVRAERNAGNKQLGELMRGGQADEAAALKGRMAELSSRIDPDRAELAELERQIQADLLLIPNLPHPSVPDGRDSDDNPVLRSWGTPRKPDRCRRTGRSPSASACSISSAAPRSRLGFIVYTGGRAPGSGR